MRKFYGLAQNFVARGKLVPSHETRPNFWSTVCWDKKAG